MIKWVALFCICFVASISPQTIISPQFSELKGMEDQQGNTHLFYRIYTYSDNPPIYQWSNHIYHLDLFTGLDTLYISESGYEYPGNSFNNEVRDVDYWNNNPAEFIYGGGELSGPFIEGGAYITRFDGFTSYFGLFQGYASYIDISQNNDSLLYAGIYTEGGPGILKSLDGGRNWDSLSIVYDFLSLCPSNENIYFVENINGELFRTTDSGNTFSLVGPEILAFPRFYYDADGQHIYLKTIIKLFVSNNLGEQFSWEIKYTRQPGSGAYFYFSVDNSNSGTIFIAENKNIIVSTDYSNNFTSFKTLDRKIVGIYKKSNSNKLYAATKYKIYEITPDTIQVIKSLPIPEEVLNFYPLAIGNKWVYDVWGWWADTTYHSYSGVTYRKVVGDTVMSNSQYYYKVFDPTTFNYPPYLFERIDTSSGKVYRYDNSLGLPNDEYLIDDLLAEVGDTIWSSRHQYQDYFPFICVGEGVFNKWGIQGPRKIFTIFDLTGYTYSLSQGVGIDSIYDNFDFGENFVTLKGCVINGVVYGDTTLTSVESEEPPAVSSFKLEQNYPNPFNPATIIQYAIGSRQFVTLKVYDILGNEIATLVNEEKSAGQYEVTFDSHSGEVRNLTSGIYFYQLKAGSFVKTKKMILLK